MMISAEKDLQAATELMREVSRISDPQQLVQIYKSRAGALFSVDRTVSLSRRGLEAPYYRITRSDLWQTPIDPWKDQEKLPLLNDGLLGSLLYAEQPVIVDTLNVADGDPAAEHLAGMGSLAAIPHFDDGAALNMVVHMRRQTHAFNHARLPEMVMLSGLFGRAMRGLVTARELREAKDRMHEQFHAVSELSDTVLEQARALKTHARSLEQRVRERTAELEAAHLDAIYMLAAASEAKDDNTGEHVKRVEKLSLKLSETLGHGSVHAAEIGRAAILHDVGKIHVPDDILKKPEPLTPEERRIMEQHTIAGERILSDRSYFAAARRVARSHHENWDGSGYPDGLRGDAIPIEARIVHLADVYDALTNARPYKKAWDESEAEKFVREKAGKMFDPTIVEAFVTLRRAG
jgi:putative nucleotidyltransferase with HDIG domain